MSYADHIFINMCKDIIENGTSTEGEKVRPKWEDGTSAYTIKQFGVAVSYTHLTKFEPGHADAVKCYTDYIKKYRIFHFYIFRNRNDHGVCHIFDQQIFCVTAIRHSDTGSSRKM